MRQEHRIGIPVPYFLWPDIDIPAVRIHIDKELRGIQDLVDRMHRVLSAYDREKGDRIEDKKERAGHAEEVAHHEVRRPGGLKFGQAVKYVKSILPFFFDDIMYIDSKRLEPVRKSDRHRLYFRPFLYQRIMAGKAEIDDVSSVFDGLLDIWLHKQPELL